MVRETVMYCHRQEDKNTPEGFRYQHFYSYPKITKMCDSEKPVLEVLVKEAPETKQDTYWGWWSNKEEKFLHVYYQKNLVKMCFPDSIEAEEARGTGKLLPVSIKKLKTVSIK